MNKEEQFIINSIKDFKDELATLQKKKEDLSCFAIDFYLFAFYWSNAAHYHFTKEQLECITDIMCQTKNDKHITLFALNTKGLSQENIFDLIKAYCQLAKENNFDKDYYVELAISSHYGLHEQNIEHIENAFQQIVGHPLTSCNSNNIQL